MPVQEVLIPMTFFACLFGIVYIYFTTRHRERMALIEKGADPALFQVKQSPQGFSTLRFGLLFVGVSLGIIFGAILHASMPSMPEETGYFSMIFMFGGLALISHHIIVRKQTATEPKRPFEN
jgi:uncharacterized membrane protein YiaA